MIRIILGIILGAVFFVAFLLFGGGEYVRRFGAKTEEVGQKIETYEKDVLKGAEKAKDTLGDTKEKASRAFEKTREKAGEYVK
ncbi:MAG: hypothetical protein AAB210_02805 [Deltaproteobacteria bacterium]